MAKINKAKCVALLTIAKESLVSETERYICFAIQNASIYKKYNAEVKYLVKLIEKRLDGSISLGGWLNRFHPCRTVADLDYETKLQETRLAWIDSLIAEHQE